MNPDLRRIALAAATRIVEAHSDVLLGAELDGTDCPEKPCFRDREFAVDALARLIQEELSH